MGSRPNTAGQVQRVGADGEGFVELPVDAELFEGRGLAAEGLLGPEGADRADLHGGVLVDE
ncbi:hypothetical protein Lfu02_77800 [Longispora fulva]|nr:hypothetical protein Lfu02_77800 [Longispora fulva]